jgi:hypothetical protein
MGRVLAIAAALYVLGHPNFDAWRPIAFDRSLREFHRDMNRLAYETTRVLTVFDRTGTVRTLTELGSQLQSMATIR